MVRGRIDRSLLILFFSNLAKNFAKNFATPMAVKNAAIKIIDIWIILFVTIVPFHE